MSKRPDYHKKAQWTLPAAYSHFTMVFGLSKIIPCLFSAVTSMNMLQVDSASLYYMKFKGNIFGLTIRELL